MIIYIFANTREMYEDLDQVIRLGEEMKALMASGAKKDLVMIRKKLMTVKTLLTEIKKHTLIMSKEKAVPKPKTLKTAKIPVLVRQ